MAERVAQPGPHDRSVLFMLPDEHRADRVWHESSFRDVKLKCQHYSREAYVEEGPRHLGVVQLLRVSGFHGVERIGQLQLDWSLVTALVERWRPEVHAFHLPFGEVGLTRGISISLVLSLIQHDIVNICINVYEQAIFTWKPGKGENHGTF
ncbi:unnamed protein product [Cuscuta epithymum]|uniref:Aminotransferase-like plant mobile domain-containing protein n=1 Tax=Cuscuta epithymum TaxID=186058 RepID=A0AAV0E9N1_9ASTE|nr:unnamed protein product [Cuscuta epithymum]